MLSRSFSPSKLPRPPPPPTTPRTKRKRGRRKSEDPDKQHAFLESPLMVQEAQSIGTAEYLEQRCDIDVRQGTAISANHPERQDHMFSSGEISHNDNVGVNTIPASQSCVPQSPSSSFDAAGSESSASASWRQRLRWFHIFQRKHRSAERTAVRSCSSDHDDGSYRASPLVLPQHFDDKVKPATYWQRQLPNKTTKNVNASSIYEGDQNSLEGFDESEWTPPDSSYGAAIPIAGWIPKSIRRTIECTLIAVVLGCIVFFVVETSVRADAKSRNHKSINSDPTVYNSSWNYFDDDQYVFGFDNVTSSNNTFDDDTSR